MASLPSGRVVVRGASPRYFAGIRPVHRSGRTSRCPSLDSIGYAFAIKDPNCPLPSASFFLVLAGVSDHAIGIELRDLVLRIAQQPAQHVLVVLTHVGRGADDGRGTAEMPEVARHGDLSREKIGDLDHRAPFP